MLIRLFVYLLAASTLLGQDLPGALKSLSYADQVQADGRSRTLSLREAAQTALQHNLDLQLESTNILLATQSIRSALGSYDPSLSVVPTWNSIRSATTSVLQAGSDVRTLLTDTWSLAVQWQQTLSDGTALSFGLNGARTITNDQYVYINPLYSSGLDIHVMQPLWRGFRQTAIDRQIRVAQLDKRIADSHFRQVAAQLVYNVANQYWELVVAIKSYEALQEARDLAAQQHEATLRRFEAGAISQVAVTSTRAEVALRERDLYQSEVAIATAQNGLKSLLASRPSDPLWQETLLPADSPESEGIIPSLEEAIATALKKRPEVEQIRLRTSQAEVERQFQRLETRPSVNLVLDGTSNGIAGTVINPDGTGIDVADPSYGGLGKSVRQAFAFSNPTITAGVELHLPIRNRTAEAALATAEINLKRDAIELQSTQQMVLVDVRNAWQTIAAQRKALEAAVVSRQLSVEQLEGETARFEAGFSTAFEVLRLQRDLTEARLNELRAKANCELALLGLERATNTILDENGALHIK